MDEQAYSIFLCLGLFGRNEESKNDNIS